MIPKGLFTQIIMVVVAVGIILTYVQPAFSDIASVQDDIAVYQEEREKVISVNSQLASLLSQLGSVAQADQEKLQRYMPDPKRFDEIAVSRDLVLIAQQSGVFFNGVEYGGRLDTKRNSSDDDTLAPPTAHEFSLTVEGTYPQVKNLFGLLERNDYPLEIKTLQMQRIEGGFLEVQMTLVTYEFNPDEPGDELTF